MVEIRVQKDGKWHTLDAPSGGYKLKYEMENPILNLDSIERVNSMSFKIPFSNKNDRIFDFKRKIEILDSSKIEMRAIILWHNLTIGKGVLIFDKGIDKNGYESYFISKGRLFFERIKNKKINTFDYDILENFLYDEGTSDELIPSIIQSRLENNIEKAYPQTKICFPMIQVSDFYNLKKEITNEKWINTHSEYDGGGLNYEYEYVNSYIQRKDINGSFSQGYNTGINEDWELLPPNLHPSPLVPMPFVSSVLEKIVESSGFHFKGVFKDDYSLKRLIFFNVKSLESKSEPKKYAELFKNSIDLKEHLPSNLTAKNLITSLQKAFFCVVLIDDETDNLEMVFIDDILANPVFLDLTTNCTPYYKTEFTQSDSNIKFEYNYNKDNKYSLPTNEVFNILPANKVNIDPVVNDSSNLIPEGTIFLLKRLGLYYSVNADFAEKSFEKNHHTINNYESNNNNKATKTIKVDFDTLAMKGGKNYIISSAKMRGNTPRHDGSEGKNPFTLLFYSTFKVNSRVSTVNGEAPYSYKWPEFIPTAFAHNYTHKNLNVFFHRSLYWKTDAHTTGTDGLINKQGERYLKFLTTAYRPVIRYAYLSPVQLKKIMNWRSPFITIDRVNYIIEKISVQMSNNEKCLATLNLRTF